MPTVDYDLRGDSTDLVRSLEDAIRALTEATEKSTEATAATDKLGGSQKSAAGLFSAGTVAVGLLTQAVAGAGAAYVEFANNISQTITEMKLFETRTGLSFETLDALRGAARAAGLELDDMVPEDLAVRIKEAAEGSGEGAAALDLLKIRATEANGVLRDGDEVFRELIEKLSNMEDRTLAAAVADDLFSDAGTRLLAVLDDGEESLDAFTERARVFGSDIGPEAIEAANEWRKATGLLSEVVAGTGQTVFEFVSGPLASWINSLSTTIFFTRVLAEEALGALANNLRVIGRVISGDLPLTELNDELQTMGTAWEAVGVRMREFFREASKESALTADAVEEDQERQQDAIRATGKVQEETLKFGTKFTREELAKLGAAMHEEAVKRQQQFEADIEETIEGLDALGGSIGEELDEVFEEKLKERREAVLDFTMEMFSSLAEIARGFETLLGQRLEGIEAAREATRDSLRQVRAQQEDADSTELTAQEVKHQALLIQLNEREAAVKKGLRAAFFAQQAEALSSIAMNTAIAITQALAQLGPIAGGFAAGAITATGAVQAGLVLAEDPPVHDGGPLSMGADEGRLAGRIVREGEQAFIVNQRGAETLDRANRDQPTSRPAQLVFEQFGRQVGAAWLTERERAGSPLAAFGAPGGVDPYERG